MSAAPLIALDAVQRFAVQRLMSELGACALCAVALVDERAAAAAARALTLAQLHAELSAAAPPTQVVDNDDNDDDDNDDDHSDDGHKRVPASRSVGRLCVVCYGVLQRDDAFWQVLVRSGSAHLRGLPPVEAWNVCLVLSSALLVRVAVAVHGMRAACPGVRLRAFDLKALIKIRIVRSIAATPEPSAAAATVVTAAAASTDEPRAPLLPIECRFRVDHADGLALSHAVVAAVAPGSAMLKSKKHTRKRRPTIAIDRRNEFFDTDEPSAPQLVPLITQLGARIVDVVGARPASPAQPASIAIHLVHDSLWIGGRYNKWARGVSQSPWIIGSKLVTATSVEDVIAQPLRAFFGNSSHAFRSAGREDKDVRMLGTGRPFMIEVIQPRVLNVTADELVAIAAQINAAEPSKVSVRDLTVVDKAAAAAFHNEDERRKGYRALVQTSSVPTRERVAQLVGTTDLVIQQRTPIRVAHRRSNITRPKTIHSLALRALHDTWFELELVTSAGTYIKEFVHGDFGRTSPSLASLLGVEWADISQLDVTDVFVPFPTPDVCKLPVAMPPPPPPADLPLFTMPTEDDGNEDGDD